MPARQSDRGRKDRRAYVLGLPSIAPSSSKSLAQLLAPLVKLFTLYFSFDAWMRSSSRAKPTSSESIPSRERNDSTMGIDAPQPVMAAGLPHSCSSALAAAWKTGADVSKLTEAAVDLRRWPRPELLDHAHALFACRR